MALYIPGSAVPGGQIAPNESRLGAKWDSGGQTYTWTGQGWQGGEGITRSGGSNDPFALAQQTMQLQRQAAEPAVQSLQQQIPEISQKYGQARSQLQAQQPSLEQRYSNLLAEIKGRQTADVNAQTRITSGELGKRGLTGSSTLAQQEIQNAVQPINTQYANLVNQTTLSQADALRELQNQIANLTPQETADQRAIANAVAQLQSGAAQTGIGQGLNLYSTELQNQLQQQQLSQQAAIAAAQNELAKQTLAYNTQFKQQELENELKRIGISGGQLGIAQQRLGLEQQLQPYQIEKLRSETGGLSEDDMTKVFNLLQKMQGGQTNNLNQGLGGFVYSGQ